MADIWAADGGVYFGYGADATEGAPPPFRQQKPVRYVGDRHLVTVGPNGSGQSRRLLLPNLAELTGWSVLVVDPKGELAAMTGKHRADRQNTIVRLNPFDALGLGSDGFNPIAALDPKSDDFPDDALGLSRPHGILARRVFWQRNRLADVLCSAIFWNSRVRQSRACS